MLFPLLTYYALNYFTLDAFENQPQLSQLYPNPANNYTVGITISNYLLSAIELLPYTLYGNVVYFLPLPPPTPKNTITLTLSPYANPHPSLCCTLLLYPNYSSILFYPSNYALCKNSKIFKTLILFIFSMEILSLLKQNL